MPELPEEAGLLQPTAASTYEPTSVVLFHHDWMTYQDILVDGKIALPFTLQRGIALSLTPPPIGSVTELSISRLLIPMPVPL